MGRYGFGIDLGATTIKLGLLDRDGNLQDKWEIPTRRENNGSEVQGDIAQTIQAKMAEKSLTKADIIGIGAGVPGPVDSEGVVHHCSNLGWGVVNVKKELQDLLDLPVQATNDANAAALGEVWKGGGQGYKDLVFITLGTGVGGGVIADGKILTGAMGASGEIGHIHVRDDEQQRCGCGNKGCLEQYTSATGMVRVAKDLLAKTETKSLLNAETLTAKDIWEAVKKEDAIAVKTAEQFGKCLGRVLAQVACVVNPQAFVIGGGVSKAGEILLTYIQKYYRETAFHANAETTFRMALLGNDAGIYGAAKLLL